ncbi:type II toxin-antitoxin system prevent-host-death family antitoxin [Thiothrix nivea]|uniref:Prevent-host-death family protein n=1 Tax=Thiothrix nivea (strain ATCC 35100 / DSM 5205 / JP2) TaxID=870187 RepID=A0A656HBS3_THINJ|nr:type II toxin-antitoxin system prevent-host-death family antitoxin [Thiothrix nivea]EIJ32900.1 prevent-host-death family protein [Thiothrix nivea DSM 5205]
MQTFTIRDLREHTGELSRTVEQGHLTLVTKHGQPLFVGIPFSESLLAFGVHVALATQLFQSHSMSLGKAAKLARMSIAEFTEHVSRLGIPVVDYDPAELDQELAYLNT